MTRSNAREIAVHLAFALGFSDRTADELLEVSLTRENFEQLKEEDPLYNEFPNEKQRRYITELVKGVDAHGPELDGYIYKYAVGWCFSRITLMAAAVMRVAMYEILYMPEVEGAKRDETPETAAFINGILGSFVRGELPPERAKAPASAPAEEGKAEDEA